MVLPGEGGVVSSPQSFPSPEPPISSGSKLFWGLSCPARRCPWPPAPGSASTKPRVGVSPVWMPTCCSHPSGFPVSCHPPPWGPPQPAVAWSPAQGDGIYRSSAPSVIANQIQAINSSPRRRLGEGPPVPAEGDSCRNSDLKIKAVIIRSSLN